MRFDIGIDDDGVPSSHLCPNLGDSVSRLERGKEIGGIILDESGGWGEKKI